MSIVNTHNPLNDLEVTDKVDIFDVTTKIWQIGTIIKKTRNKNNAEEMMLYNFTIQLDINEKMKIKIRHFNRKRLKPLNTVTPIHSYLKDNTKQVCNCQKANTCDTCKKKFCIDCYGSVMKFKRSGIKCYKCYDALKIKTGDKLDVFSIYDKRWYIATVETLFESNINNKTQIYVLFDGRGGGYRRLNDYKPLHTYTPIHAYLKDRNMKVCFSDNSKICKFCRKKYCNECYSSNKKTNCMCYQCFLDNTKQWLKQLKVNDKLDIHSIYNHDRGYSRNIFRWYIGRIIKMFPGNDQMKILIKFENNHQSEVTELVTVVFNDVKYHPNKIIEKLQPLYTHTSIHRFINNQCKAEKFDECSLCWKNFCIDCALLIKDKKYVCFKCVNKVEFAEKLKVVENLCRKINVKIEMEINVIYTIAKYSAGTVLLNCGSLKCDDHKIFENKFEFLKNNSKLKKFRGLISFFCGKCNEQKMNEQKQWLQCLKIGNRLDILYDTRWYIGTVDQTIKNQNYLKMYVRTVRLDGYGGYYDRWHQFNYNEDVYKIMNKVKPLHSVTPIHEYTINKSTTLKICVSVYSQTEKCNLCLKTYCSKCIKMISTCTKDGMDPECPECIQKNEYTQKHKVVVIIIENELYGTNIQIEQNVFHIITRYAMGYVLIECGYMRCLNHFRNIERFADFSKFKPKINWFCSALCKENEYERMRQKHIKNLKNSNEKEFTIQKERERQRNERKQKEMELLAKQEKKRNKKRMKKLKKKEKKKRKKQTK